MIIGTWTVYGSLYPHLQNRTYAELYYTQRSLSILAYEPVYCDLESTHIGTLQTKV